MLNGWPTRGYLAAELALQQAIRRTVCELAGQQIPVTGVDGCGAPLFALTLTGWRGFRALVLGARAPERWVADAMRTHRNGPAAPAATSGG